MIVEHLHVESHDCIVGLTYAYLDWYLNQSRTKLKQKLKRNDEEQQQKLFSAKVSTNKNPTVNPAQSKESVWDICL